MFKSSIIFLPYSFFMKPSHFHVPLLNPSLCFQWRSLGKSHPQTMAPWYTGDLNVAPNSCQVLEASVWQSFVSERKSPLSARPSDYLTLEDTTPRWPSMGQQLSLGFIQTQQYSFYKLSLVAWTIYDPPEMSKLSLFSFFSSPVNSLWIVVDTMPVRNLWVLYPNNLTFPVPSRETREGVAGRDGLSFAQSVTFAIVLMM